VVDAVKGHRHQSDLKMSGAYAEKISLSSAISASENEADEGDGPNKGGSMGYQQTLMYGRYSKTLGEYAKEEASRQREIEAQRKKDTKRRMRELSGKKPRGRFYRTISTILTYLWQHTFAKIGEDWVFLALLGIMMAVISFVMDEGIDKCNAARRILYDEISDDGSYQNILLKYMAWVSLPVCLVLFSAGFVHIVAPQAIGSGIPEMKTILRGVVLKEYLTPKTLIAKMVGLTATLGSGMPLGKEGPFVHIASIVATLLTSMITRFQGIYTNESRQSEMLAAAVAVGVACCFGSPIGGVLFSIEVTSVLFSVRNYWRGFFAAVCGATMFRLLAVWFHEADTIIAVFRTEFDVEFPYDAKELILYVGVGIVCGCGGALYVKTHRMYVLWMRGNKSLTKFLQRNRFIYPFLVALLISTLSFPPWLGQYQAGHMGTHDQIALLFSHHSWTDNSNSSEFPNTWEYKKVHENFVTANTGIFANMLIYMAMTFFTSIVAATLPVPTGVLIPAFKIGAAFGRLVGEAAYVFFPGGFRHSRLIMTGGYATVGAAAFSGAVTHTISISVIVFEMTGQITHIIPVLIAVLIANALAALLQPSCYDSIIMIKKLPYLPDILPSSSNAYKVYVEDFMLREVKYIWVGINYRELREVLKDGKKLRSFPLVDNPQNMILLGSIQRTELITAIEQLIGKDRRIEMAIRRHRVEIDRLKNAQDEQRRLLDARAAQEQQERSARESSAGSSDATTLSGGAIGPPAIPPAVTNLTVTATPQGERRPSRFEITSVPTPKASAGADHNGTTTVGDSATLSVPPPPASHLGQKRNSLKDQYGIDPDDPAVRALQQLQPKKSILKKTGNSSYTVHGMTDSSRPRIPNFNQSPQTPDGGRHKKSQTLQPESSYKTVTGTESSRFKSFRDLFSSGRQRSQGSNIGGSPGGDPFDPFTYSPGASVGRGSGYRVGYTMDMTLAEQHAWEEEEMLKTVDVMKLTIDPAPFQLVEKSSLVKVHSMFSLLSVKRAYVTAIGRLIGVVGLKELRSGIEDANSGHARATAAALAAAKSEKKKSPPPPDPQLSDSADEDSEQEELNKDLR